MHIFIRSLYIRGCLSQNIKDLTNKYVLREVFCYVKKYLTTVVADVVVGVAVVVIPT